MLLAGRKKHEPKPHSLSCTMSTQGRRLMRTPRLRACCTALLAVAVAAMLVMPVAAAGAQTRRTFVFGQSGDATQLDPALIEDGLSARVTVQIFETLAEFD